MATKRSIDKDTVMVSYVDPNTSKQVRKRFSRKKFGPGFKRAAEDFYAQMLFDETGLASGNEHRVLPARRMTVQELADRYLEEHLRYTKAWGNRTHVRIFTDKFGKYKLSHISNAIVRPWVLKLLFEEYKGKRYSASTVKKVVRYAVRIFNWGIEAGLIDRNPLDHVIDKPLQKHFRRGIKAKQTIIPSDDFERMQGEFPQWLARMALASWCSGMREGEVCNLRKSNVDGNVARIVDTKEVDEKFIVLDERLVREIMHIDAEHSMNGIDTDFLFLGPGGGQMVPRNLSKSFRWHCDNLGFTEYTFHDLRRSYINRKEQAGVSLRAIAQQVGHHAVETTKRHYMAKVSADEMQRLADA